MIRRYSREKTVQVLIFVAQHRVPANKDTSCRPPTQTEAAQWFKIPQNISGWWRNRDEIVVRQEGSYRIANARWMCEWPEMNRTFPSCLQSNDKKGGWLGVPGLCVLPSVCFTGVPQVTKPICILFGLVFSGLSKTKAIFTRNRKLSVGLVSLCARGIGSPSAQSPMATSSGLNPLIRRRWSLLPPTGRVAPTS